MTVFTEPDRLMTYAWDDFDPRHPRHDPASARRYGDLFLQPLPASGCASWASLSHEWQDKATIIIVSDHGFAGVHRFFYPNVWLQQHGYLALKQAARPSPLARAKALARAAGRGAPGQEAGQALLPRLGLHHRRAQRRTSCSRWTGRTPASTGAPTMA